MSVARLNTLRLTVILLVLAVLAPASRAASAAKQRYELSAGDAATTLQQFVEQSGEQVIYLVPSVRGVTTNSIEGRFTVREALDRMLAHTVLIVVEDSATGALMVNGAARSKQPPAPFQPRSTLEHQTSKPMKQKNLITLLGGLLALIVAPMDAQTAAGGGSATQEEVVKMSPFVVSTDKDTGYAASQTLAGTRIASNVDDIAAQVTVMTPQFLEDVGAATLDEALLYSLNVENLQEFADADEDALAGVEQKTAEHGNHGQRSRGLSSADSTSDFFTSEFSFDSYNTERFTFNSGPNAILFGLGSPSGVIDQSQKRARFRESNQVTARVDSEDGYRGTLDINRVLVPEVLAVRGSFLYSDAEGWRKPSRTLDRRQFVTATYRPFERTTLRASYENLRVKSAIPRNQMVKDAVTPYLNWRAAEMERLGITDPFDQRLYWAPDDKLLPGEEPDFRSRSGGTIAPSGGNDIIVRTGEVDPSTPLNALIQNKGLLGLHAVTRAPHNVTGVGAPDNFTYSLVDPSIYPFDVNPNGLSTQNDLDGSMLKVFLEHQFTRNFAIEVGYQKQRSFRIFTDWIRGIDSSLQIDAARYIPDADDPRGYSLNPNRGKFYLESWPRGSLRQIESDDARVSASYNLDFTEKSGWVRWLGKHSFVGVVDYNDNVERTQNHRAYVYSDLPDDPARFPSPNVQSRHRLRPFVYLSSETPYYDINTAAPSAGLDGDPFADLNNVTFALRPNNLDQGVHAKGTVRHVDDEGSMFAVQSRFWDGRIVTTYGRRHDKRREISRTTPKIKDVAPPVPAGETAPWYYNNHVDVTRIDSPGFGDADVQSAFLEESGDRESKGIVVRPLTWLSLHYNEANNSGSGSSGFNPNGGTHEPSSGEGQDYGFGLKLFDGRLFLKVNQYETAQTRVSSSAFRRVALRVRSVENTAEDINEFLKLGGDPEEGIEFAPVDVGFNSSPWDVDSFGQTPVLSDIESKGTEISMIANLRPNWRLSLNAGKTRVVESNIAGEWFQFVASREPEWQKLDDQLTNPGNLDSETLRDLIDREVYSEQLTLAGLVDGRPSLQVRRWRVNLVTSYDFRSGILRDWGVGGAVRWRDKGVVGLASLKDEAGNVVTNDGSPLPDINNPFYDDGLVDIDGWISYTRKFGDKVRAKFQLNVRNLFDDDRLIATRADSTGANRRFTLQSPRQFIFTTTFDF